MPFNVMIQLCKVTRASKLFQRNFFLPLMKPLSPKDAMRRHLITGKNILGARTEHYIPVLEEYKERVQRRKYMVKGSGKKRQRKKSSMKYVQPFFDDDMENHGMFQGYLGKKSKGKGQSYTYFIPDKNVTIVLSHQFERCIRDRDVIDVIVAQRSEKIVVKCKNGKRVTLPLCSWDGHGSLYAGEGWTKKDIEEYHHHGKDTMSMARLFEAKESGVEEWELEMMRMANKRKTKHRGEGTADWGKMMEAAAENMDWEKFEEESKQIVEESGQPVEDEPIAMEIDDMDKTKNVNEKLKAGGDDILELLPNMAEIPEIIKIMTDGVFCDICDVSGVTLTLPSSGKYCFIAGQMVKSEDGDIFMPGQTVDTEGTFEFTPGFTVLLDEEPTLIAGLVMGNDPTKPMFLPGDSTITESGELQFTEMEDDFVRSDSPVEEAPYVEEVELEEEQNSEEEAEEQKPPPKREKKEFFYERPQRFTNENEGVKRRPRGLKKPILPLLPPPEPERMRHNDPVDQKLYDMTVPTFEKEISVQEKERTEKRTEKKAKEDYSLEKRRREIKERSKKIIASAPPPPEYKPLDPVTKSDKLEEYESKIKSGDFFEVDYKQYLVKERHRRVNWLEPYDYQNTFSSVGINRHRIWKSVH